MNILFCGGSRQQGIHIINSLLELGIELTVLNRHGQKEKMSHGKLNWVYGDRTSAETMRNAISGKHFDIVVDTSAVSGQDVINLLDNVKTDYYIQISSNAVYNPLSINIAPESFDPKSFDPKSFDPKRATFTTGNADYQLGKRNAEKYAFEYDIPALILRMPYICGLNDKSGRLKWFVEKILKYDPFEFNVDYVCRRFAVAHESEAARFIMHAIENKLVGIFNCASDGIMSVDKIIGYIEYKTGKYARFKFGAENHCHYNNVPEHSLSTDSAKATGHSFLNIEDWLYDTLDFYIDAAKW
ncbi:MAG: NAD-dependent epimerase/dehydratase family protein [Clostridiales bacterium]|jgi:nucleoside-diphosphate-sugar epimerase|nr:NAD-dependent epimerase/dehydratase family protein [Clostridiales bacterium]